MYQIVKNKMIVFCVIVSVFLLIGINVQADDVEQDYILVWENEFSSTMDDVSFELDTKEVEHISLANSRAVVEIPDENSNVFEPIWPLPGVGSEKISCWFKYSHRGIDICAKKGTPIVAAQDGEVVSAEYHYSWGNNVFISHNDKYHTRYAHMTEMAVSAGDFVTAGQVIGYVGNTGNSFGNHLHFEVYEDGTRIDPYQFLS